MSPPRVLVTGATGQQGGATARALLASDASVHALVRSPDSPAAQALSSLGVTLHTGSFSDEASLGAALAAGRITCVFLNTTPCEPFGAEIAHAANVVRAAQATPSVTHIIYTSIVETGRHETFPNWGAFDPDGLVVNYWLSKARIEALVRGSGVRHWTILRPSTFMSNYHDPSLSFFFPEMRTRHVFRTAIGPETKTMLVSPGDIGRFAAAVILRPDVYSHREIDIGVEALTPGEITEVLSRVAGREIVPEQIPRAEAEELGKSDLRISAELFFNETNTKMDLGALRMLFPDIVTRGFEEYLLENKEIVRRSLSL